MVLYKNAQTSSILPDYGGRNDSIIVLLSTTSDASYYTCSVCAQSEEDRTEILSGGGKHTIQRLDNLVSMGKTLELENWEYETRCGSTPCCGNTPCCESTSRGGSADLP